MLFYSVLALASIVAETNAEKPAPPSPVIMAPTVPNSSRQPEPKPRGNPGAWVSTADYPSIALQKQLEGTTGFGVTVGPDGRVTDCVITSSSGSSDLDVATCTNVKRRARFAPALDANGSPTIGKYANRVRWQIPSFVPLISFPRGPAMQGSAWAKILPEDFPQKALAEQRQGKVTIELAVSATGLIEGCKVIESSTHEDIDTASCKRASERAKFQPALDFAGQPTAGRVQTELNWRLPGEPSAPPIPVVIPSSLLPKAGKSSLSFTVAADGSITDCSGESTIGPPNFAPDAICKLKVKLAPYTDENGKPVARRVTTKTTVEVQDVK
jgi:TonB family protein